MKRTFQFGLIFALLDMPRHLAFNLLVPAILYGSIQEHSNISIKENSLIYKTIFTINNFTSTEFMLFGVVWMVLVFLLAWKMKIFSKEYGIELKDKRKNYPGWWKRLTLQLSLAFLFGFSLIYIDIYIADNFFMGNSLSLLDSFGWRAIPMFVVLIPQTFFYSFCAMSSIFVALVSLTSAELKENIKVPIAGLAVLGVVILTSVYFQHYLDLNKSLKDIPGYSKEKEARSLVVLYDQPKELAFQNSYYDVLSMPENPDYVSYNSNNVKGFNTYLHNKGYYTKLKGAINSYTFWYELRELEIGKARNLCKDWLAETAAYEPSFLATSLGSSPNNTENYSLLKWLSDESKFTVSDKSALRVSQAYNNFGDMEKAKYWYNIYLKTRDKKANTKVEEPPVKVIFNNGVVNGIIRFDGQPVNGLRVGIIRKNNIDNSVKNFKTSMPPLALIRLTDGASPSNDGRFTFTGITEGEYVLLLSLKTQDNKTAKVLNSPGTITISKDKPTADAGVIRLVY